MNTKQALELLKKHGTDKSTGDIQIPVNPQAIAEAEGIKVISLPDVEQGRLSGKLSAESKTISINPSEAPEKQRFAIAHMLGCLKQSRTPYVELSPSFALDQDDTDEVLANIYALELLMPLVSLQYYVVQKRITSVQELTKLFGVSVAALRERLETVDLI